jgi:prepilin-type N-terminal cleavage/methylation domain-containing protein/prepilin-type processing-associated H-X9-DG protein
MPTPFELFIERAQRKRRGFTLVELMVCISVVALLAAIILPVLGRVRETARDTQCKSNLRQIGQGLTQFSSSSSSGEYCTGAWDWKRDGSVTDIGWVADLISQGTPVGDLLCPSSPYVLSRVYHQLLTMDPSANTCADSFGRPDVPLPDGSMAANPTRLLNGATNRAQLVDELFYQKKFNTNYAASWFLVRSEAHIDNRGQLVNKKPSCTTNIRERACTVGPLTTARVGGRINTSTIPIMACGNAADMPENILPEAMGDFDQGAWLSDSYSTGPRDPVTLTIPAITASGFGPTVWFGPWNNTLQDFRAFGPVHGGKRRGTCNIVMVDGSVKVFTDENGDGFSNNGFPASTVTGYADDVVELPPAEIHSGWSLDSTRLR